MNTVNFSISDQQLNKLLQLYPNIGKNSHIGKLAIEVAKLYFLSLNAMTSFVINKNGIDLTVESNGNIEKYEIKGTADNHISWEKLKVSSQNCHDHLVNGMTLIRITNIGSREMTLYFLQYQHDFVLKPEPRWSIVQVKNAHI